ncbi:type VI secretion protein [Gammaproteobacteria bacterium 45_16_T64]|nr:type VI secretion protein [Gammaproteobacteria bacterium 45_16_T64]
MRVDKEQKIRPSIFDRLLDNEPEKKVEDNHDQFQATRSLRESVRRDLEQLFNTRYRITSAKDNPPELELSLVNYGLPDLATINLVDEDTRIDFCRSLETTIRRYEPRFKSIKVHTLGNVENEDRTVRFRIDAVLHADPAPEVIIFDSVLEPVSRSVEVIDTDK